MNNSQINCIFCDRIVNLHISDNAFIFNCDCFMQFNFHHINDEHHLSFIKSSGGHSIGLYSGEKILYYSEGYCKRRIYLDDKVEFEYYQDIVNYLYKYYDNLEFV